MKNSGHISYKFDAKWEKLLFDPKYLLEQLQVKAKEKQLVSHKIEALIFVCRGQSHFRQTVLLFAVIEVGIIWQ